MEACTKHHKIILPSPLTSLLLLARNVDENGHGVLLILLLKEANKNTNPTIKKRRFDVFQNRACMQLLRLFLDMGNFVEF